MENFGTESFSQKLDEMLQLSKENNRMLKAMRRDRWFGAFLKLVFWIAILGASYYFTMQYLAPVVESLEQIQAVTGGISGGVSGTIPAGGDVQKMLDLFNQYKGTLGQ